MSHWLFFTHLHAARRELGRGLPQHLRTGYRRHMQVLRFYASKAAELETAFTAVEASARGAGGSSLSPPVQVLPLPHKFKRMEWLGTRRELGKATAASTCVLLRRLCCHSACVSR